MFPNNVPPPLDVTLRIPFDPPANAFVMPQIQDINLRRRVMQLLINHIQADLRNEYRVALYTLLRQNNYYNAYFLGALDYILVLLDCVMRNGQGNLNHALQGPQFESLASQALAALWFTSNLSSQTIPHDLYMMASEYFNRYSQNENLYREARNGSTPFGGVPVSQLANYGAMRGENPGMPYNAPYNMSTSTTEVFTHPYSTGNAYLDRFNPAMNPNMANGNNHNLFNGNGVNAQQQPRMVLARTNRGLEPISEADAQRYGLQIVQYLNGQAQQNPSNQLMNNQNNSLFRGPDQNHAYTDNTIGYAGYASNNSNSQGGIGQIDVDKLPPALRASLERTRASRQNAMNHAPQQGGYFNNQQQVNQVNSYDQPYLGAVGYQYEQDTSNTSNVGLVSNPIDPDNRTVNAYPASVYPANFDLDDWGFAEQPVKEVKQVDTLQQVYQALPKEVQDMIDRSGRTMQEIMNVMKDCTPENATATLQSLLSGGDTKKSDEGKEKMVGEYHNYGDGKHYFKYDSERVKHLLDNDMVKAGDINADAFYSAESIAGPREVMSPYSLYPCTDRWCYDESQDAEWRARWKPSKSQRTWYTYNPENLMCELIRDRHGNYIQVFAERRFPTVDAKNHWVQMNRTQSQTAPIGKDSEKIGNRIAQISEVLDKDPNEILLEQENEIINFTECTVRGATIIVEQSAMGLISDLMANQGENGNEAGIHACEYVVREAVFSEEGNDNPFINKVIEAGRESPEKLLTHLRSQREKVGSNVWSRVNRDLTDLVNDILKRMGVDVWIDSFEGDLTEMLNIINNEFNVLSKFKEHFKEYIDYLYLSSDEDTGIQAYTNYLASDLNIDLDNDPTALQYDVMQKSKHTYLMSRIMTVSTDLVLSVESDKEVMVIPSLHKNLYKLCLWMFHNTYKVRKHYIISRNGIVYEVKQNLLNDKYFTIRKCNLL